MINPVTVWFKRTQYDDKCVISIVSLDEAVWFSRYSRPTEIMYDQVS